MPSELSRKSVISSVESRVSLRPRRARVELVDLQMIGVREVDQELRRIVGEANDAVAALEIDREQRARPHVVEGERDRVLRTPEEILDPRRLPPLHEIGQL